MEAGALPARDSTNTCSRFLANGCGTTEWNSTEETITDYQAPAQLKLTVSCVKDTAMRWAVSSFRYRLQIGDAGADIRGINICRYPPLFIMREITQKRRSPNLCSRSPTPIIRDNSTAWWRLLLSTGCSLHWRSLL